MLTGASKELHDGSESGYSKTQFMGGDIWAWILAACALLISLLGLDKRHGREWRERDRPPIGDFTILFIGLFA